MREIAGPGHVSNRWVDYDPVSNPLGTVFTADFGNDVQDELVGIQDEMGIAEAAGTNKYVLAALKGLMRQERFAPLTFHYIGGAIKAPAEFDKDDPESYFPARCLDNIATIEDIDEANYPDLISALRAWKFHYLEGLTGAASAFTLSNWAITTNVATLTFASNAANAAMLAVVAEFYLATGYRPVVNVAATIGNIPAGDYLVTAVDTVARTITFACTASNGSGATTDTVEFYPHRIVGSTTTARLYNALGMAIMSAGSATHMSGQMRRSYMQGHYHQTTRRQSDTNQGTGGNTGPLWTGVADATSTATNNAPSTDGTNGTPRTGTETEPRSITAHLYIGAGRYIA